MWATATVDKITTSKKALVKIHKCLFIHFYIPMA